MEYDSIPQDETKIIPLTSSSNNLEDMERSLQQTDRFIEVMDSIRKKCVRLTNRNDWVDQNGVPYLEASGCDKIAKCFGVQIYDITCEKEHFSDDTGDFFQFTTSGSGKWLNNVTHEIGVTNTKDKFFAKKKVDGNMTLLPLSEIDLPSVKKKSHTNFMNRIIKKLLGLSYTWEEIEEMSGGKINRKMCQHFAYDKGKKGGTAETAKDTAARSKVREMILELCGGDGALAKKMLIDMTEFTADDGKKVKGRSRVEDLTLKQLNGIVYPQISAQYKIFKEKMGAQNE